MNPIAHLYISPLSMREGNYQYSVRETIGGEWTIHKFTSYSEASAAHEAAMRGFRVG